MTQQSLITRLKAVEEALSEVLATERATNRPPSTVMEAEAKLDRIRASAKQADAALSDLRELIKEAEGQAETAAMFPDGFVAKPDDLQFCQHRSGQVVRLLYTALGEKP